MTSSGEDTRKAAHVRTRASPQAFDRSVDMEQIWNKATTPHIPCPTRVEVRERRVCSRSLLSKGIWLKSLCRPEDPLQAGGRWFEPGTAHSDFAAKKAGFWRCALPR